MAKHKLTEKFIRSTTEPGRHSDGGNLYLRVRESGTKTFVVLVDVQGKRKEITIGNYGNSARDVTLADARSRAAEIVAVAKAGGVPTTDKPKTEEPSTVQEPAKIPSFGAFALELIASIEGGFKNEKHRQQWRSTLKTYCEAFWNKPIDQISTADVLDALAPIWLTKQETASRVRARIERVLGAAKAKGFRSGENPASLPNHLADLLPKQNNKAKRHHPALPYQDIQAFWKELVARETSSARALQMIILTCGRSGEVRAAKFDEFDLEKAVWTIPAERMKAGRMHRVPLTTVAIDLVKKMQAIKISDYLFPGIQSGRPITDAAISRYLKGLVDNATPHGFRSTFRDWVGDETDFAREVAEAALAHAVGDQTELAYRRGDAFEKRRTLMEAWTAYVTGSPTEPTQGQS